jgi:hypothetical protein|tara:strand:+ start:12590 stop:12832 length:243 start_codon:yes stop_codon:yes gene_type:complete
MARTTNRSPEEIADRHREQSRKGTLKYIEKRKAAGDVQLAFSRWVPGHIATDEFKQQLRELIDAEIARKIEEESENGGIF